MIEKIMKLKVYWTRAATYFQVPFALFNYASLFLLLSRQYGFSGWLVLPVVAAITTFYVLVGWLDVKMKVFQMEVSFGNNHNVELMKVLEAKNK